MSNPPARWVDALQDRKIPALRDNIQRCSDLAASATASLTEIAHIVNRDPGLLTLFLSHANRARVNTSRPLISTIESTLNLMGMAAIQNLLSQAEVLEDYHAAPEFRRLWLRLILRSYHAGRLAQMIAEYNSDRAPSEVYTAGFLSNIGEFCVGASDPEKFVQLSRRQKTQPRQKTEMEVLESHCNDIGGVLASRWGLPELLQDTFNTTLKLGFRVQPCTISQQLAFEADMHGWSGDTMDYCYGQLGDMLRCSAENASSQIHGFSAVIAREFIIPDIPHAAIRLVQLPGEEPETQQEKRSSQTARKVPADQKQDYSGLLQKSRTQLQDALKKGSGSNDLIRLILGNLIADFGFERALLMLPDKERKTLAIKANPGFPASSLIGRTKPRIDRPGLFANAMQKIQMLWINDERFQKFSGTLPEEFIKLTQSANFIIITLGINEHPIGVIIADKAGKSLDKALLVEVNKVAALYSMALTQSKKIRPA
jgi:HD-like signal output (HDOD) protein